MPSRIHSVAYYLPQAEYPNARYFENFADASPAGMEKIGIKSRRRVGPDESASDLAYKAAVQLFNDQKINPESIDFLIVCNLEPDYYTPPTSCVLHGRLNLPKRCGAWDYNHGCSAYVYGLAMADGVISTMGAKNVLLLTTSTLSRTFHAKDKSSHFLFGDGASATLIQSSETAGLGPYVYGTDGSGYRKIIVEDGYARNPISEESHSETDDGFGNITSRATFRMDGMSIFRFTMNTVPPMVNELLEKSGYSVDEIDYFVFHQANRVMNESIRKKLNLPEEKFIHDMELTGNTVQSTIPIALKHLFDAKKIRPGSRVMLVGFGVGLSWIGTVARF